MVAGMESSLPFSRGAGILGIVRRIDRPKRGLDDYLFYAERPGVLPNGQAVSD
jgi:hypothetical protein